MVVVRIKTLFEVVLLFSDSSKYVSVASNLVFIADNLFRFCGRFFVCVFFFFFIWIVSIMSVSILLRIYFVMHFVLRHNGLLFYFEKKKKQNTIQKL